MRANEKGLNWRAISSPDVPCALTGDPNRLHQILVNLISNAIKFTEKGSVILEVTNDAAQGGPGAIRFYGQGHRHGYRAGQAVDDFRALHASRCVDCQTLRRYGAWPDDQQAVGGVDAGQDLGRKHCGRRQHISLRCTTRHKCGAKMPYLPRPIDLHGLRSLSVDDHPINRKILVETLSSWNAQVTAVGDGQQAVAALRQAAESSHPYGLLLIDCRMPGMDGFQVVDTIRRSGSGCRFDHHHDGIGPLGRRHCPHLRLGTGRVSHETYPPLRPPANPEYRHGSRPRCARDLGGSSRPSVPVALQGRCIFCLWRILPTINIWFDPI